MKHDTRRVVITGYSVAAGNGRDREEFYANCMAGKLGIRQCTLYSTQKLRTGYFGQTEAELVYEPASWQEKDRMEALMELALEQLYQSASFSSGQAAAYGKKGCLCLGTLLAATGKIMAFARKEAAGEKELPWLSHTVEYGPWLKKRSGIRGGLYIDSAACASGTTAVGLAFDLIRRGKYEMALAGGADPLTEVSAAGFHALQSLSLGICNPFDESRDGINIGEGAAFFLLETLESARERGAQIYGEVLGYGLNNDAYHITSPDPEGAGAAASMEQALEQGGILPEQVDYINAHGTGTPVNDPMECKAIAKVFGKAEPGPAVNSTKALVGHCMGASGAVELAAVLLSMEHGTLMPMPGLKNLLEEAGNTEIRAEGRKREISYALSNSFAFAGNTASLLVGAWKE